MPVRSQGRGLMARLSRAPGRIAAAPPKVGRAPKVAAPFYLSAAWKALVASIIKRRGRKCEDCGAEGYVIGDHVNEIRDGGALLDEDNIMLLCAKCHGRKTAKAKRARLGL
jgi:5-methylcytosine-specific restriction endonuclease McrA